MNERKDRLKKVNQLVKTIGDCGRRSFYNKDTGIYATLIINQNGKLFWFDEHSERYIYLHDRYWKRGFSHGGTLHQMVNMLKDYVMSGKRLPMAFFNQHWGYGDDMEKVTACGLELEMMQ